MGLAQGLRNNAGGDSPNPGTPSSVTAFSPTSYTPVIGDAPGARRALMAGNLRNPLSMPSPRIDSNTRLGAMWR